MEDPSIMSIMLLGLTGSGKSASGNTIIGVKGTFKEDFSPVAVTRTCNSAQTVLDGQSITVIDTVGLSDTSVKVKDAETQIEKMFTVHSVDVFLLVIKLGDTFPTESMNVVQWIQDNLGAKALKHSIVLFTHGDQLHGPIERYLRESETLRSIVDQCSGGVHVFKNKDGDRSQVTELLEKINSVREKNGYRRYTEQDKKTQKGLIRQKCDAAVAAIGAAGATAAAVILLGAAAAGATVGAAVGGAAAVEEAVAGARAATAAGAGVAATVGAAALTVGKAAIIGAARCAALAVVTTFVAGVYLCKQFSS